MRHDIRELILKECKAKHPEGVSFSDLKVWLMDKEKMIKGKSTLSKYLKILVKEGLLERDVDTRRYRITQEGIAFLNETEILARQTKERVRRPYIFDDAKRLCFSPSPAEGEEKGLIEDFITKFLRRRRQSKEAVSQIPLDLLIYWRKLIPFECQIYLAKEFNKYFDDFLKELEKYPFDYLLSFFSEVANALYRVVSRNVLINGRDRQKEEEFHVSRLKEDVEKVKLLKRSGFILVAWPRTPGWLQRIEEEGGLELAFKKASELDKLYEEGRKKMGEIFENDPNARRVTIRYYALRELFQRSSFRFIETCRRLKEEKGASENEAFEKLKEEVIEGIKREVLKTIKKFCKSEPKMEEIDEEIKWIEKQGYLDAYLDAIVKYTWADSNIASMYEKVRLEFYDAIKRNEDERTIFYA